MLNAVLEKLQNLISARLIVASFFPVAFFIGINGFLLYLTSDIFRVMVMTGPPAGTLTSRALLGVVIIVALTYAFSALQPWLRQTLEGTNWPEGVARWARPLQWSRYRRMRNDMREALQRRDDLLDKKTQWLEDLKNDRGTGAAKGTCAFQDFPPEMKRDFNELDSLTAVGAEFDLKKLETAINKLRAFLVANSSDLKTPGALRLDAMYDKLTDVIERASQRADLELTQSYTVLKSNFADDQLAPTAIGNVAATAVSYAFGRYRFNLETLWSRLQKVMQADDKFYGVIQDAKTQLDFVVGTLWAFAVSGVVWLVALPFVTDSVLLFAVAAVFFPVAVTLWYAIALASYRAFTDLMRSSVDLYRFNLVDALHLHKPSSLEAERGLWDDVDQNMSYDGNIDLPYEHTR
jgi:hypothetical protein